MAQTNPNADVRAANSLVGTTHIMAVTDVSAVSVKAVCTEAQNEGFVVVAVEGLTDGDHIAVQGAGATPSFTGATLVATFS